jgi:hypothetical protein
MSAGDLQRTYDPQQVIITVGGVIVSGFGDGDFITVSYDEERYNSKAGADGEVARAKNANRMGTFEMTLSATSAANAELSALFNLEMLGGFDVVLPVAVADLSGTSGAFASKCWIKQAPEFTRGKDVADAVWQIAASDLTISY